MMYGEWIVDVRHEPAKYGRSIWIYRRDMNGKTILLKSDGTEQEVKYDDSVPPTMYLDENVFQKLIEAIGPSYKAPEKPYLEGKVEAQSEHLKDLRKLLKL